MSMIIVLVIAPIISDFFLLFFTSCALVPGRTCLYVLGSMLMISASLTQVRSYEIPHSLGVDTNPVPRYHLQTCYLHTKSI
ncbi:hypothetical protein F4809DRAFT_618808 [Biscogniauxia mediterranea]|nr:hypothetical protein F4809DRAFT_618808 [Biscogniauxia mediterranea]